jgi:hypothetical protein
MEMKMKMNMKKTMAVVGVSLMILGAEVVLGAQKHIKASLVPIGGSGATGFIQITQQPHGGANLHVVAKGLDSELVYASFYYESADCSLPADSLGVFTANTAGVGVVHGKIDEDLDEVGSVSVRIGPGYGQLIACATLQ